MKITQTFDEMKNDVRWLGFGYLNEREHLSKKDRKAADEYAIKAISAHFPNHINQALFDFANSKIGRWYGEQATMGTTDRHLGSTMHMFLTGYDPETGDIHI